MSRLIGPAVGVASDRLVLIHRRQVFQVMGRLCRVEPALVGGWVAAQGRRRQMMRGRERIRFRAVGRGVGEGFGWPPSRLVVGRRLTAPVRIVIENQSNLGGTGLRARLRPWKDPRRGKRCGKMTAMTAMTAEPAAWVA